MIIHLADKDRETIRRKLIAAGHQPTAALMANIKSRVEAAYRQQLAEEIDHMIELL